MTVRKNATKDSKKSLIEDWYREELSRKLNILIPRWEEKTGLNINSWQIKKNENSLGKL